MRFLTGGESRSIEALPAISSERGVVSMSSLVLLEGSLRLRKPLNALAIVHCAFCFPRLIGMLTPFKLDQAAVPAPSFFCLFLLR